MTGKQLLEFLQTIDEDQLEERVIIQLKSGEWVIVIIRLRKNVIKGIYFYYT